MWCVMQSLSLVPTSPTSMAVIHTLTVQEVTDECIDLGIASPGCYMILCGFIEIEYRELSTPVGSLISSKPLPHS